MAWCLESKFKWKLSVDRNFKNEVNIGFKWNQLSPSTNRLSKNEVDHSFELDSWPLHLMLLWYIQFDTIRGTLCENFSLIQAILWVNTVRNFRHKITFIGSFVLVRTVRVIAQRNETKTAARGHWVMQALWNGNFNWTCWRTIIYIRVTLW